MNALCYKIVFSKRLGALVAVGEHTSGQGKAAGTGVRTAVYPSSAVGATAGEFVGSLKAVFASVALTCFTATTIAAGPAANTLPTGYSVNSGNVAVSTSGADMTIKQTTDKASVNWQSFSIGSAASVNIQQNSASSVLLNRVVGNDPSQIFGKLTANGQVILINPNGIVFGKGGSVTASAFTASTFGMTEDDFNKGKRKFSRDGSTHGVTVENGATINTTAPGGYVALIGASVDNQGAITTKEGAVVLAAGESVALPAAITGSVGIPLSSKVRLELAPSTINASVENGGTITTDGGQVLMQAAALSDAVASITHTGTIDTTGDQGGAVTLQADNGNIKVTGSIKASSTADGNKGGDIIIGRDEVTGELAANTDVSGAKLESNQGFVETSGDWLATYGTRVKAKDWLLDPLDIVIDGPSTTGTAYSDPNATSGDYLYTPSAISTIRASDIAESLNDGTNVTITTGLAGSPGSSNGNITVKKAIEKTGNNNAVFTLEAYNGITVDALVGWNGIGTAPAGKLDVVMKANGLGATSQGLIINKLIDANGGTVLLEGKSKSTSSDGVKFGDGAGITAAKITVTGDATAPRANANYSGISFNGTNLFKSTGADESKFTGSSTTLSNTAAGIMAIDSAKLTLDSTIGTMVLDGTNTNRGYRGVRIGGQNGDLNITTTKGNITFQNTDERSQVLLRGSLKADGIVTFKGGTHVDIYNTASVITLANNSTINLISKSLIFGEIGSPKIGTATGGSSTVNIKADRVVLAAGSSINTGNAGTVNISTYTPAREILVGADDVTSGITKMGLTQSELNSITAKNLFIGDTASTGNITVSGVTTASNTGNITLQTGGAIDINGNLSAASGKDLTIKAKSDVTVGAVISQAGTGTIVLAAGFDKPATDISGGQVKRKPSSLGSVSNIPGKTYIYTGSVSGSTVMGNLNNSLNTLLLDNTTPGSPQNAQSNAAFGSTLGIPGSNTAGMQVLYREKIGVNLAGVLTDANKTYGEVANNADARLALNAANTFTTWTTAGTSFTIKRTALVDTMSLTGDTYSASNRLNAKTSGYDFTSSTYTLSNGPKLFIAKAKLAEVTGAKTYDGKTPTLVAGSNGALLIKGLGTEQATLDTGKSVGLNNPNAGLREATVSDLSNSKLASGGSINLDNYDLSLGATTNEVTVNKKTLTAIYAANNKVFDGTSSAIVTGILKDKVSGDDVSLKHTTAAFGSSDVGDSKLVTVSGLTLEGGDASNYILHPTINAGQEAKTTASITRLSPTPPIPVVPTNNAGTRVKVPVGSANPFALASAEDLADDTCSANSVENCYCEESAVSQGVDICYEPKTAAKGSVR